MNSSVEQNLDQGALRERLAALDREWQVALERFQIRGQPVKVGMGTTVATIATGVLGGGFSMVWIIYTIAAHAFLFTIFGLVGLLGFVIQCVVRLHKASMYKKAYDVYQQSRQSLVEQIRAGGGSI